MRIILDLIINLDHNTKEVGTMKKVTSSLLVPFMAVLITFSQAFAGHALRFNRNNHEYVNVIDSESLDIRGQAITIESWIFVPNPGFAPENMIIINKEETYETKVQNHLFQVAIHTQGNWAWVGTGRVQANTWTHVACTFDGRNIRTYLNGQLQSTHAKIGNIDPSNDPLCFGKRRQNDLHHYTGDIDEIRIWNIVRSEAQLQVKMNVVLRGDEEGLVGYWRMDEGRGQIVHDQTENENHGRLGSEEEEDNRDPEWIVSGAPIHAGQITVDRDQFSLIPLPIGEQYREDLVIANISEEEDDIYIVDYSFRHEGDQPDWLTIEPDHGEIAPREETVITLTIDTEGLEPGDYAHTVTLETNAENIVTVELPITFTAVEGIGRLYGRIIDADNDQPLEGASVDVIADFELGTITNENGNYEFPDIPAYIYHLRITAPDYLPLVDEEEIVIEDNGEIERNYELLHAEFHANMDRIELAMQSNDTLTQILTIRNIGNGSLTWRVERVFPDEMQIEPWEHRWNLPAADSLENDRLGGIAYDGTHFYVAGGVRDEDNIIYVLNRVGELQRQFPQFAESNYGIRDLTWDGNLLWGYDEGRIYGFNTEGQLIEEIEPPMNMRAITWDPDHELFWICNITTDIIAITVGGQEVRVIERPDQDLHIYGLGWYPEDADGYNLYAFCCDGEERRQVYKINIDSGEAVFVYEPEVEGRAGAMTITGIWDPYSWVLIGMTQSNPDAIEIWQLDARTDWLSIAPVEGIIDAGGNIDLGVQLNTLGLPLEEEFTADLRFTHDGVGGVNEIPVLITVTGEGGVSGRILRFSLGWNMVSLNVIPPVDSIRVIMRPLVEADLLNLMKDGIGRFYNPEFNFNNIPGWNVAEGYQVKVSQNCELPIEGEVVPSNTPIPLIEGWQIVSYYPRQAVDAITALGSIVDNLIIAKDENGRFYVPEFNFNGIGNMLEGEGYQLKMTEDDELVYRLGDNRIVSTFCHSRESGNPVPRYTTEDLTWLLSLPARETSYSLLVLADDIPTGTRLEAFTPDGILAGRGVVGEDGMAGLALWGDDTSTDVIDGFREGEEITISTIDNCQLSIVNQIAWTADGWKVVRLKSSSMPVEFGLRSAYPNPFNGQLRVEYGLEKDGIVELSIYDLTGREVSKLHSGQQTAGIHMLTWDAGELVSGIYLVRLSCDGRDVVMKVVLVR